MNKKGITRFVAILLLFVALYGYEENKEMMVVYAEESGEWSFKVLEDDTIEIQKYNGKNEIVVIPSEIDGKK